MMKPLVIVALSLLLAACSPATEKESRPTSSTRIDGMTRIVEVTSENGVECVALIGYNKGGISCNWEKYNKNNNE